MVYEYLRAFNLACVISMKKSKNNNSNRKYAPNISWNSEISNLRKEMNRYRRCYQRALKMYKVNPQELEVKYKTARKKLKCAITDSKISAWRELCEILNKDPWGRPYKYIMNRARNKVSIPNSVKRWP